MPQVPIIWVEYYPPSGLLVNKYAHPNPLTPKGPEFPIAVYASKLLHQRPTYRAASSGGFGFL